MTTIMGMAMAFVVKSLTVCTDMLFRVNIPQPSNDITEYKPNIRIEATHAVPISVSCCLIDEKDGLMEPKASLVVAVEPTIDPTSPVVSINAG